MATAETNQSPATANQADTTLHLTRHFDAPRDTVFRAWIEREAMMSWMGPEGFTVTSCEVDAQPGGAWRVCMHSPDGNDM